MSLPQPRAWAAALRGALRVCLMAGQAAACSIPVFRCAFERWPADLFVATVEVADEATAATKDAVHWLEDQAQTNGGPLNLAVELAPASRKPELVPIPAGRPRSSGVAP